MTTFVDTPHGIDEISLLRAGISPDTVIIGPLADIMASTPSQPILFERESYRSSKNREAKQFPPPYGFNGPPTLRGIWNAILYFFGDSPYYQNHPLTSPWSEPPSEIWKGDHDIASRLQLRLYRGVGEEWPFKDTSGRTNRFLEREIKLLDILSDARFRTPEGFKSLFILDEKIQKALYFIKIERLLEAVLPVEKDGRKRGLLWNVLMGPGRSEIAESDLLYLFSLFKKGNSSTVTFDMRTEGNTFIRTQDGLYFESTDFDFHPLQSIIEFPWYARGAILSHMAFASAVTTVMNKPSEIVELISFGLPELSRNYGGQIGGGESLQEIENHPSLSNAQLRRLMGMLNEDEVVGSFNKNRLIFSSDNQAILMGLGKTSIDPEKSIDYYNSEKERKITSENWNKIKSFDLIHAAKFGIEVSSTVIPKVWDDEFRSFATYDLDMGILNGYASDDTSVRFDMRPISFNDLGNEETKLTDSNMVPFSRMVNLSQGIYDFVKASTQFLNLQEDAQQLADQRADINDDPITRVPIFELDIYGDETGKENIVDPKKAKIMYSYVGWVLEAYRKVLLFGDAEKGIDDSKSVPRFCYHVLNQDQTRAIHLILSKYLISNDEYIEVYSGGSESEVRRVSTMDSSTAANVLDTQSTTFSPIVPSTFAVPVKMSLIDALVKRGVTGIEFIKGVLAATVDNQQLVLAATTQDDNEIDIILVDAALEAATAGINVEDLKNPYGISPFDILPDMERNNLVFDFGRMSTGKKIGQNASSLIQSISIGGKADPIALVTNIIPAQVGNFLLDMGSRRLSRLLLDMVPTGRGSSAIRKVQEWSKTGDLNVTDSNDLQSRKMEMTTEIIALANEDPLEYQRLLNQLFKDDNSLFGRFLSTFLAEVTVVIPGTVGLNAFHSFVLRGIIPQYDGLYYVTNIQHSLSPTSFTTNVAGRLNKTFRQILESRVSFTETPANRSIDDVKKQQYMASAV